jgi:hypothetical protein
MKDIQRKRWSKFHIRLKRFMKNGLAPIHDQENFEEKNKFAPLPLPFWIPTQKHLYPFFPSQGYGENPNYFNTFLQPLA